MSSPYVATAGEEGDSRVNIFQNERFRYYAVNKAEFRSLAKSKLMSEECFRPPFDGVSEKMIDGFELATGITGNKLVVDKIGDVLELGIIKDTYYSAVLRFFYGNLSSNEYVPNRRRGIQCIDNIASLADGIQRVASIDENNLKMTIYVSHPKDFGVNDKDVSLFYAQIVLHELAHITFGPHPTRGAVCPIESLDRCVFSQLAHGSDKKVSIERSYCDNFSKSALYVNLGNNLRVKIGRAERLYLIAERALQLDPQSPDAYLLMAKLFYMDGNPTEGRKYMDIYLHNNLEQFKR
jgi:hypothetical protein